MVTHAVIVAVRDSVATTHKLRDLLFQVTVARLEKGFEIVAETLIQFRN